MKRKRAYSGLGITIKAVCWFLLLVAPIHTNLTRSYSQENEPHEGTANHSKSDSVRLAIDFDAVDLQGQPFKGLSLKGKIVFLDFWAVWCGPCIEAFPALKKLDSDFKDASFEVVGIAVYSGTVEDVTQVVEKYGLDYRIVVGDEDLVERFGVIGVPTYVLIGPDGHIYKKYVGAVKGFYEELEEDISKLRKEVKIE